MMLNQEREAKEEEEAERQMRKEERGRAGRVAEK